MGVMREIGKPLSAALQELCLPSMRRLYESYAVQAQQETWRYEDYLYELANRECETRRQNRVDRWLRESQLPLEKSLESFDRNRLPPKVRHQINTLRQGNFLQNRENVLAFGNPGSGKTHLLCALAQELVRQEHRVYFRSCHLLVQDLLLAKQELRLSKWIKNLSRYELLLIDDIGYVQHNREEMEVLFTLLSERYERGSVMITSNLPFSQWERIFKDPMTTAAVIDRLVHHCLILELNLPSYRMEKAKKSQEKKGRVEPQETQ